MSVFCFFVCCRIYGLKLAVAERTSYKVANNESNPMNRAIAEVFPRARSHVPGFCIKEPLNQLSTPQESFEYVPHGRKIMISMHY